MRMAEAARFAGKNGSNYFTTVLSISPHKDAARINEIGFALQERFGVKYLPADFKKKEGFKKSLTLSKEHGFYRQDYCGCLYSKRG
jgi:predicted adenine nucleotide alpha hydrolase (AANH) superfamily ATPase